MKLGDTLVLTFIFAAATLCGSISIIFAATLSEGESLIELIFWPVIGFLGFSIALVKSWYDHTSCASATLPLYEQK